MLKSQLLSKTIEPQPVPTVRERPRRASRVKRIELPPERPPDKRVVVVHNFQWHLIIRSLAFLILALALVV